MTSLADKLEGLAEKATAGPWDAGDEGAWIATNSPDIKLGRTHGYGCGNDFVASLNDGEYHEYYDGAEQHANAALIVELRNALPTIITALRDVERMREALKPFAEAADHVPPDQEDFKIVAYVPGGHHALAFKKLSENLTAGHFRRARQALGGGDA